MELIAILTLKKQGDFCGDVELFNTWYFFIKVRKYSVTSFGQASVVRMEKILSAQLTGCWPGVGVQSGCGVLALDCHLHFCGLSVKFFCGMMASKLQSLSKNVSKVE